MSIRLVKKSIVKVAIFFLAAFWGVLWLNMVSYAQQGQSQIVDVLNSQNTRVLQSVAQCLPSPEPGGGYEARAYYQHKFGLVTSIDGPTNRASDISKYHYISVFKIYQSGFQSNPWRTLISVKPDGNCTNLIPLERQSYGSLMRFMPLELATQLVLARYKHDFKEARDWEDFRSYIENRPPSGTPRKGEAMDRVPSRDRMNEPYTCELHPEDAAAVTQLGLSHQCRIKPVQ